LQVSTLVGIFDLFNQTDGFAIVDEIYADTEYRKMFYFIYFHNATPRRVVASVRLGLILMFQI